MAGGVVGSLDRSRTVPEDCSRLFTTSIRKLRGTTWSSASAAAWVAVAPALTVAVMTEFGYSIMSPRSRDPVAV